MIDQVAIQYSGKEYSAVKRGEAISLSAKPGAKIHFGQAANEADAIQWLCDRSLRKSKARQLMAAVLRDEGPFAAARHPRRRIKIDQEHEHEHHGTT